MRQINSSKLEITAFILNLVIVMFETAGVVLSVLNHRLNVFQYYTENSNYFALVVSTIYCIAFVVTKLGRKQLPTWVHNLRFISTSLLSVTFIVILFVLSPLYPKNFVKWMFLGSGLFQHTLCPIISIISFLLFENQSKLYKRAIWLTLIPTVVYGITCIILNLTKTIEGPYPFFYLYDLPLYFTLPSLAGVLLGATLISFIIYWLHNKRYTKLISKAL